MFWDVKLLKTRYIYDGKRNLYLAWNIVLDSVNLNQMKVSRNIPKTLNDQLSNI